MEERDCPDQSMLGCNDCDFCVLPSLACHLESKIADNIGDCHFLFGENDNDDEPKCINGQYGAMLKKVWKTEEFIDLARRVRGDIGTHSIRKFASTWASENGCTTNEVEIRGRWKGTRGGRVVNRCISVEQSWALMVRLPMLYAWVVPLNTR